MDKQRIFSLKHILYRDAFSFGIAFLSLLFWVFYIIESYSGYLILRSGIIPATESDIQSTLNMAIVVTIMGIAFLIWRLLFFRTLYMRGVEVTGHISLEYVSKQRVEYKYTYQGVDYWRGNALTD